MAQLPGAISLAPSKGSSQSRRSAGSESQPRCRIAPLLPCLPLIPVKQQTRPVWGKIQKEKLRPKHSLLCRFLLHLLLLLLVLLRDVLQRKRVTGLDTALGEGESRQTLRDVRPETGGGGCQPLLGDGRREARREGPRSIGWVVPGRDPCTHSEM